MRHHTSIAAATTPAQLETAIDCGRKFVSLGPGGRVKIEVWRHERTRWVPAAAVDFRLASIVAVRLAHPFSVETSPFAGRCGSV
jgi:hypothetical protein